MEKKHSNEVETFKRANYVRPDSRIVSVNIRRDILEAVSGRGTTNPFIDNGDD